MVRSFLLCAALALLGTSGFAQEGVLGKKGGGGGAPKGTSDAPGSRPRPEAGPRRGAPQEGRPSRVNDGRLGQERPVPNSGSVTSKGRSRSGTVRYGSSNNQAPGREPVVITNAPAVGSNGRIVREVGREDRVRAGHSTGYRSGYWHYDRGWRDDRFWYPYYGFAVGDGCLTSPFYYYGHVPGYLQYDRVRFGSFGWSACTTSYGWDSSRSRLGEAVDEIRAGFLRGDADYFDALLPRGSWVTVEIDCESRYQVNGDDFYDMLRDVVESTRTVDYRVLNVWRDRNEATVEARHTFRDAWGRSVSQRHVFGLRERRRGYEIVYFRSTQDRWR